MTNEDQEPICRSLDSEIQILSNASNSHVLQLTVISEKTCWLAEYDSGIEKKNIWPIGVSQKYFFLWWWFTSCICLSVRASECTCVGLHCTSETDIESLLKWKREGAKTLRNLAMLLLCLRHINNISKRKSIIETKSHLPSNHLTSISICSCTIKMLGKKTLHYMCSDRCDPLRTLGLEPNYVHGELCSSLCFWIVFNLNGDQSWLCKMLRTGETDIVSNALIIQSKCN